MFSKFRHSL